MENKGEKGTDKSSKQEETSQNPQEHADETQVQQMLKSLGLGFVDKKKEDPDKPHKFWDTQPVPKLKETIADQGPIDREKTVADINKDPYNLPDGFEWCVCDVDNAETIKEVYTLLNENYVEDDDNMFRFDYSINFLRWALKPPGYYKDWHVGVRVSKNKKLVAFITGIPSNISVYDKVIKMAEINFLCVHKKLRDKRLAPVLIKEVTRRVNLQNIWQAVYTAGRVLPKPISSCRYYHRSLNPKKLIEVGFSHLAPRMTIQRTVKLYKLPDEPALKGMRPLQQKDVKSACKLLNEYLKKFSIKSVFDEHEFAHWFLPIDDVIYSFVIEDPNTHEITHLTSFYSLPSTIINNPHYKTLRAAYSFYNVSTTESYVNLIRDALVLAKKNNFDVYNCLDIMENESILSDLKFGKGDGNLQYYLYNWKCPDMTPPNIGLVLL